jgi:hypothetical protein
MHRALDHRAAEHADEYEHAHLNRAMLCLAMVVVVMVMAFERRRSAVAHCVVNVLRARGPM